MAKYPFWFGAFCRWLAAGKTYPRPPHVPREIPKKLWPAILLRVAEIKARRPKPRGDLGIFGLKGVMVGYPNSGAGGKGPVEDCTGMRGRGYRYALLNAFDGKVKDSDWGIWRRELDRVQIPDGRWARCYSNDDCRKLADLAVADPFTVFNLERELQDGRVDLDYAIRTSVSLIKNGTKVCWSTEGAVYQSMGDTPGKEGWKRVTDAGIVVTPQSFQEANPNWTPKACVAYAANWGCDPSLVVPTLGSFPVPPGPRPVLKDYDWDGAFMLYLTDFVESWGAW